MIATMPQITVEYSETLPQVFLSRMKQFVLNHQNTPPSYHFFLNWQAAQETTDARKGWPIPQNEVKEYV